MVYAFSDYELDTRLMELRRAGEACPVEPQVFDVLRLLMVHRDRVVTRRELLQQVWGHAFVTDATLSSRVMAARRAIGDSGEAQAAIRTVRGRGYRFVAPVRERRKGGDPACGPVLEEMGLAERALARGARAEAAAHLARALRTLGGPPPGPDSGE